MSEHNRYREEENEKAVEQTENVENAVEQNVKVEIESKMYRIYEMRDELTFAIKNIESIIKQQTKLINIISKNKSNKEEFKNFISELASSISQTELQKEKLSTRIVYLNSIIEVYETRTTAEDKAISKTVDLMITYLANALGI